MGIYLSPHRVDLRRLDGLRNGKDKAWKQLLPKIEPLSVKEREPFEHFVYEETLPAWHAVKYLRAARFLVRAFGSPLETGIWGLINYPVSHDIFAKITTLIKALSLPVSLVDDVEQCSGALWGMPLVDGVALARMDSKPIQKAARILKKTFATTDELLQKAQTMAQAYQAEPAILTCLRNGAFCYQVGHWDREEFSEWMTLHLGELAGREALRGHAEDLLDSVWGGEEQASYLFDGTQKFFAWISEAAQHEQGLVFFVE